MINTYFHQLEALGMSRTEIVAEAKRMRGDDPELTLEEALQRLLTERSAPRPHDRYQDHSPFPWTADDCHGDYAGMLALVDANGELVVLFGDMEDCSWRDICNAHAIAALTKGAGR